jgi:hypothetical protein
MASTDVNRSRKIETDRKRNNIATGKRIITKVRNVNKLTHLQQNAANQEVLMTQTSNGINKAA